MLERGNDRRGLRQVECSSPMKSTSLVLMVITRYLSG